MYSYNLSGKNKYYTLYECIRGDILRGRLKAGEKLPGKRTLASELGVSVVTVQTAYEQLLAEGYVTSKERSGYFVCALDMGLPRKQKRACGKGGEKEELCRRLRKGQRPSRTLPVLVVGKAYARRALRLRRTSVGTRARKRRR